MTGAVRPIAIGVGAALRTPVWLRGGRLRRLLGGCGEARPSPAPPEAGLRAARATLRVLGRIPLLPWRNTCLYRSVAECLVLRSVGVACRLRIGVRHTKDRPASVEAHAWVEWSGAPAPDPAHVVLSPSG